MENKPKVNKRPFSSVIGIKNGKKHVAVDCDCNIPDSSTFSRPDMRTKQFENQIINSQNQFNNSNKNFIVPQNPYYKRFKSQNRRKNMYNEMWTSQKNDTDLLDLKSAIKIRKEKEVDNYTNTEGLTSIDENTRLTSANTQFHDIGYTSKRLISAKINSFSKNKNKKLNIKTESDLKKSDDAYVNIRTNNNGKIPVFIRQKKSNKKFNNNNIISSENKLNSNISLKNLNIESKDENEKEEISGLNKNEIKKLNEMKNQAELKKVINQCNTTMLKLRTEYLIKYSKIQDLFKKLEQVKDCFRVDYRDLYCGSVKTLTRYFDKCNGFLLNEIKVDEILDYDNWSLILLHLFNFCTQINKIQKYFSDELHFIKNENLIMKQKMLSQDSELHTKNKEISEINDYILKYDLTNKVKYGKKKEASIQDVKQKFNSQEAGYVLTIHKLQEEINQLTNLLDQNKNDLIKYKTDSAKLKKLQLDCEKDKDAFEQKISEKEVAIKLLTDEAVDLNEKILELENEIQQFKEKEKKIKLDIIEYEAKIKNLNDIVTKDNEMIDNLEKENRKYKERKIEYGKMMEPVEQVFVPMKEKLKKRQHT